MEGHLLETSGRLFLYMRGITLGDAFRMLETGTEDIRCVRYGTETAAAGRWRLYAASEEENGMISAALKKE